MSRQRAHAGAGFGRAAALLTTLGLLAVACPAAAAPSLNPFRRAPRVALAQDPVAPATPAPAPAPASVAGGGSCRSDDQCPTGTICEAGRCTAVEPPIRALLFRKEGGTTAFYPFYFAGRGNPGHRVLAPFYWHFWSPESRTKIVAPFYWRFEDHAKQRAVTVIPPYSQTVQPDARSWAVWPIFYKSTKFGWAAPLLGSFKIENPEEQRSFGLYALLYFWKRNERAGTSFDLFFPFFVSKRGPNSAFTFTLPLNFYWRDGDDKNLLVLPLLYWGSDRNSHTLVTPVGYHSRSRENHRGSVAWLYWFGRKSNGDKHDVLFPVLWSFRGQQSSTTILPLFAHLRRPTYSFTTFFPLYWAARNPQRGSSWHLFAPLFFARTREEGRFLSWITPIGGYRRDADAGTKVLGTWLPPMLFTRSPRSELDMVLALYWRYKDKTAGSSTTLLGPFYRSSDPAGSTTTLFPLFWHFRDAATGATAHSLFPLYFRRSSPTETLTAAGVFPAWAYYRNYRDGGFSAGLAPLAFFGSRPARGHGVVFPLFWHFRDDLGTSTVAAPFFYRFTDRQSTQIGVPPLLYFYGQRRHEAIGGAAGAVDTTHVQFPLFWRFRNGRTGVATTVIPPLYWRSSAAGWSAGLFPLLFAGSWADKGHFVLPPLLWHFRDDKADKRTTLVLNYLHRRHGSETTDALFPLVYFRRGAKPGGAPETSFTLLPLVHYRRTPTTKIFASPIAATYKSQTRKAGLIPPFFWWESRDIAASGVPLLYLDLFRKSSGERTRQFGPFVAVDGPKSRARVLFPLFARYGDDKETGTWVFPTYFRRRHVDSYALDTFLPLFWYSRSNQHTTTVVGPLYRRTGPDRSATGLVPLFFHARSPERRYLITPLFYDRDDYKQGTGRLIAALLFYRSTRPDGHTTVGFPLYWSSRTKERAFSVFFPLFWRFVNDEARTRTTILGPFYASSRGDTQRTRGILPIAWYTRDDEKRTASHAFLPLFYEKHGPNERNFLTVPFGFGRSPDSSFWYVPPIFRRTSATSTFTTVFPLFFNHFNKTTETRTTVIPPLAFFSRSSPARALHGLALLFWRHRDIGSATTLALPFFYDVHNYHESRFTLLAPVFMRYWRASDDTTYSLAPLFYRRGSPNDSTTVLFPFVWDFKSAERRSTVVFPFFASFRRPTYVSRFIFPNIYYRRGEGPAQGTSRLFIFPLWESAAKRPGDTMWEVLLGLFGYERIGRNRYLKVLFIPFELEPAPAAQTAWYGRKPKARRERRYGLDTAAW